MKNLLAVIWLLIFSGNVCSQELDSVELEVAYPPPPIPQNLKGELIEKNGKNYIRVSWDEKSPEDTLTYGYYVHTNFPPKEKLYRNGRISLLDKNTFDYEVKRSLGSRYLFAVAAVTAFPDKVISDLSTTLEVLTPSRKLPLVKILSHQLKGEKATITWRYQDVGDLEGFKIFMNGKLLEQTISNKDRSVELTVSAGKKRTYVQMIAYSSTGIESGKNAYYFLD